MKLSTKQQEFSQHVGLLIGYATTLGYGLTFGDAWRRPNAPGHPNSLHKQRLAVDLNLFIDGEYRTDTEAHEPLGTFWKGLHAGNRWGGDFKTNPDGNHYSRGHEGMA